MILYVKHIDSEGPETIGEFFQEQGFHSQTVELWRGDPLPWDLTVFQAIVVLGGPMNVYEETKYPFLQQEDVFIKRVVSAGIPYLGVCLGAQLLAKACGATVEKSPEKEVGFFDIRLTEAGKKDFLFQGVKDTIRVFQWHEDAFAIPPGSQNLAISSACPQQAFRMGKCAYGLQFHVEVTDRTIHSWTKPSQPEDSERWARIRSVMLNEYQTIKGEFDGVAQQMYRNFLHVMNYER